MDWGLRGYGIQWLWVKGLWFVIIGILIPDLSPLLWVPLSIALTTFPIGPLAPYIKLGPKPPSSHSLMLGL